MFDAETAAFLETGCALIVGTVDPMGEPHATRAWGATVLSDDRCRVRLLLDADDRAPIEHLGPGDAIAVTATSVRDLRSMQLKGRVVSLTDGTEQDGERAERYCQAFYLDIVETDGIDPQLPRRLTPTRFSACVIEVDELFDQTPGPRAGAAIQPATSS